jgi:hypothetical protein
MIMFLNLLAVQCHPCAMLERHTTESECNTMEFKEPSPEMLAHWIRSACD